VKVFLFVSLQLNVVRLCAFPIHGLVGSPVYYLLCFASFRVNIKECSRKLNQHGHQWEMRMDQHSIERRKELAAFCELVLLDREANDESAEYNRTLHLDSNPNSDNYRTAAFDLAEITGGKDFDRF
jgi:hypothetical protein